MWSSLSFSVIIIALYAVLMNCENDKVKVKVNSNVNRPVSNSARSTEIPSNSYFAQDFVIGEDSKLRKDSKNANKTNRTKDRGPKKDKGERKRKKSKNILNTKVNLKNKPTTDNNLKVKENTVIYKTSSDDTRLKYEPAKEHGNSAQSEHSVGIDNIEFQRKRDTHDTFIKSHSSEEVIHEENGMKGSVKELHKNQNVHDQEGDWSHQEQIHDTNQQHMSHDNYQQNDYEHDGAHNTEQQNGYQHTETHEISQTNGYEYPDAHDTDQVNGYNPPYTQDMDQQNGFEHGDTHVTDQQNGYEHHQIHYTDQVNGYGPSDTQDTDQLNGYGHPDTQYQQHREHLQYDDLKYGNIEQEHGNASTNTLDSYGTNQAHHMDQRQAGRYPNDVHHTDYEDNARLLREENLRRGFIKQDTIVHNENNVQKGHSQVHNNDHSTNVSTNGNLKNVLRHHVEQFNTDLHNDNKRINDLRHDGLDENERKERYLKHDDLVHDENNIQNLNIQKRNVERVRQSPRWGYINSYYTNNPHKYHEDVYRQGDIHRDIHRGSNPVVYKRQSRRGSVQIHRIQSRRRSYGSDERIRKRSKTRRSISVSTRDLSTPKDEDGYVARSGGKGYGGEAKQSTFYDYSSEEDGVNYLHHDVHDYYDHNYYGHDSL